MYLAVVSQRLAVIQVGLLLLGLVGTFGGVFGGSAPLLMLGGVGLIGTGLLSLIGVQVALGGPLGRALRAALGGSGVARAVSFGLLWILAGGLVLWLSAQLGSEAPDQLPAPAHASTGALGPRAMGPGHAEPARDGPTLNLRAEPAR